MTDTSEALKMAEIFLKEMLQADDTKDFELYTKRFEPKYLESFSRDIFSNDIEQMHERNGMNRGYEFLGTLRNATFDNLNIFRSVWKGIYEKRDAVIEIGIYQNNGNWHVITSSVH